MTLLPKSKRRSPLAVIQTQTYLLISTLTCSLGLVTACSQEEDQQPLTIYSSRQERLIQPLLARFSAETGIETRHTTNKAAALIERIAAEGTGTSADLLLTVDAGTLYWAASRGLLKTIDSPVLKRNIPRQFRDPEDRWFGLSLRARAIVYSTLRAQAEELSSYAELASPKWRGRLCLRTSKKVYNQSLVATMIAHLGLAESERIVRGWVANLAAKPFASDTKAILAVLSGRCDVTLVNTYYFGHLQREQAEQGKSLPLAIFWPNQGESERGTHVNISGAGVVTHSKRSEQAIQFIEWLSTGAAQELFANGNLEFPVNASAQLDPLVESWGSFRQDQINLHVAGELQSEAIKLMEKASWH